MTQRQQCLQIEQEYREWHEYPLWYCVRTILNDLTGTMKSDFVRDEKTKLPLTIRDEEKPADGVFQIGNTTTYYTYFNSYEEAALQIAAATV